MRRVFRGNWAVSQAYASYIQVDVAPSQRMASKNNLCLILSFESNYDWTSVSLTLHLRCLLCIFDDSLLHKTAICRLSHAQARVQLVWCSVNLPISRMNDLRGLPGQVAPCSLSVFAFGYPYGPQALHTLRFASIYWPNFTTQRLPLPFLARAFSSFPYFNSST